MGLSKGYDVLIMCTVSEIDNIENNLYSLKEYINPKNIILVGNTDVRNMVKRKHIPVQFIDEDVVYPGMTLQTVKDAIQRKAGNNGGTLNRGGWYFQQFLKMAYAHMCVNHDYLIWDGDTIPTHRISMYAENGKKFFDVKTEYCKSYFRTLKRLFPELNKNKNYSYISEHMIIDKAIMKELIEKIERNSQVSGNSFWEKIINAIDEEDLPRSGFSEYETYGMYASRYYPTVYTTRNWHSLREGTIFYPNEICKKDLEYLAPRYDAVSFERRTLHFKMQKILGFPIFQKTAVMASYQKLVHISKALRRNSYVKELSGGEKMVHPF